MVKTVTLTGFMSRQWTSARGEKFRKQVVRNALRESRGEAVEIRLDTGAIVDRIPSDAEAAADGYSIDRSV